MNTNLQALVSALLLLAFSFYSLLENALSRMTPMDFKLLQADSGNRSRARLSALLQASRAEVLIPLVFLLQLLLVAFTLTLYDLLQKSAAPNPAGLTVAAVGLVVLLAGHLTPWALLRGERTLLVARLYPAFRPLHAVLHVVCRPLIAVARRRENPEPAANEGPDEVSDAEVKAYLDVGEEEGIFEPGEGAIIRQVVEFGDTMVREVMTPRPEMTAIRENATLQELKDLVTASRHSRIPVYRDTIDSVTGTVYVRDLLAAYSFETSGDPLDSIVRPAFFVPETKKVAELLREMQNRGELMALVVDEYGGIAGLATLEDLLEEIVGEIRDEDQPEEEEIAEPSPGEFILNGDTEIGRLGDKLGLDLYDESYNTVAGMVIAHLGRFPRKDETISMSGLNFHVLEVDSRKVLRIRITREQTPNLSE